MGGSGEQPASDASSITVFYPAYNDAQAIASMVIAALQTSARLTTDYEVIVANDASTDYTADVLDDLAAHYPRVRIIHNSRNLGYGGNLRVGFANATKDLVF